MNILYQSVLNPRLLDCMNTYPDSKVYGANMGPTWVLSAPHGPHVDPMSLLSRECVAERILILVRYKQAKQAKRLFMLANNICLSLLT